ncbi:rhodanese-like domain-containing protein [Brevibacillus choshinensis]|uniref:Rhodanese-like domain-containing protein n=1 Tax=Brevibacillus choshinensis TaxID=54911 RepID=A0ABX7FN09_BRECH|nr:rhodanese-like domain-containing protein [Brevibacillus choshinensis]QRG67047.1 rhodanese-like domain-containing protein [Brevibacillus choshinensis]
MSLVLQTPAALPQQAANHFLNRLSVETDVSDVWSDIQNGVSDFLLIDVRSESAYQEAHLPGALSLPHPSICEESTTMLDSEKLIVVYCWSPACNGATKGAAKLAALGFRVKEMLGGIEYWRREGHPVEGRLGAAAPLIG